MVNYQLTPGLGPTHCWLLVLLSSSPLPLILGLGLLFYPWVLSLTPAPDVCFLKTFPLSSMLAKVPPAAVWNRLIQHLNSKWYLTVSKHRPKRAPQSRKLSCQIGWQYLQKCPNQCSVEWFGPPSWFKVVSDGIYPNVDKNWFLHLRNCLAMISSEVPKSIENGRTD